jgi:hypothetical protein
MKQMQDALQHRAGESGSGAESGSLPLIVDVDEASQGNCWVQAVQNVQPLAQFKSFTGNRAWNCSFGNARNALPPLCHVQRELQSLRTSRYLSFLRLLDGSLKLSF